MGATQREIYKSLQKEKKSCLTKEMNHKSIVVTVNVGGRIGLELDGHISHGGVELEVGPCAAVLTQDVGRQVVAIIECQLVILTHIEPETKGVR